jgi:hypothetical protein
MIRSSDMTWISECCSVQPADELDMSTIQFGGPLGFCSGCSDKTQFVVLIDHIKQLDTCMNLISAIDEYVRTNDFTAYLENVDAINMWR